MKESFDNFKRARFFMRDMMEQYPNHKNFIQWNLIALDAREILYERDQKEGYF